MATIGLDRLYYAKITENDAGEETYGTPSQLAKAISADLSVELAEATLYADDGASEIVKEFKSGTLSLGIDDIGSAAASDLTGATIDKNKVLISASEDGGDPVAVGFRAKKSNGKYKYYWLYRVKFGIPATNLATKGDSITFSTPTIEGTILRRNKADAGGKHPWKAEALEGDVTAATITNWYKESMSRPIPRHPKNRVNGGNAQWITKEPQSSPSVMRNIRCSSRPRLPRKSPVAMAGWKTLARS